MLYLSAKWISMTTTATATTSSTPLLPLWNSTHSGAEPVPIPLSQPSTATSLPSMQWTMPETDMPVPVPDPEQELNTTTDGNMNMNINISDPNSPFYLNPIPNIVLPIPSTIMWRENNDGNLEIECRQTRRLVSVFPRTQVDQVMEQAQCNEETAIRSLLLHQKNVNYAVLGLIA